MLTAWCCRMTSQPCLLRMLPPVFDTYCPMAWSHPFTLFDLPVGSLHVFPEHTWVFYGHPIFMQQSTDILYRLAGTQIYPLCVNVTVWLSVSLPGSDKARLRLCTEAAGTGSSNPHYSTQEQDSRNNAWIKWKQKQTRTEGKKLKLNLTAASRHTKSKGKVANIFICGKVSIFVISFQTKAEFELFPYPSKWSYGMIVSSNLGVTPTR